MKGDQELIELLEADAAGAHRLHGRFILGEPQAVVALLNESADLDAEGLASEATRAPELAGRGEDRAREENHG